MIPQILNYIYNEKSTKHKHTHLDLNIFAVDHLNNTHNIVKDETQFLTVIWKENKKTAN